MRAFPPTRRLTPERLDSLPPDSPEARHSRADLRFINRCMGNTRWIVRRLRAGIRPGEGILELGAGDGALLERIGNDALLASHSRTGVDLIPAPEGLRGAVRWIERDLRVDALLPEAEVVIANLVLHHLTAGELRRLGRNLPANCRVLLACEPFRARLHQFQAATLRLAGASEVTLHDARVSIEAGFRGDELAGALGLAPERWTIRTERTWLGAYRLTAVRREA